MNDKANLTINAKNWKIRKKSNFANGCDVFTSFKKRLEAICTEQKKNNCVF